MSVKIITTDLNFQSELVSHGSKLSVVYFTASWCMPCRRISPVFNELAAKYTQAVFLKVDVNNCENIAMAQGITSMPTFIFYINKIKVDLVQGANAAALEEKIKKYITEDTVSNEEPEIPGQIDLIPFIVKGECKALNECDDHPFTNCLSTDDGFLESECDEQLIMPLTFNQSVKIHSIKIKAPTDKGPKTIKLFINQPNILDFDKASSNLPVQELCLKEEDLQGNPIGLSYVKFQNVQNIHIFVKDNQTGQETTQIDYMQLIGRPNATTNMNDFKRVSGKTDK